MRRTCWRHHLRKVRRARERFQPTKRPLTPTTNYFLLVRTNEPFEDFKAAIESERAYVRKALLRAQEIFFHRCVNKHPVIIMRNFAGFDIKETGSRAIDSAVRRCITVRPRAIKKVDLGDVFATPPLYRLTGPTEAITTFASFAKPQNHFNVKASHVEGASPTKKNRAHQHMRK
jgi:hypothetical protein